MADWADEAVLKLRGSDWHRNLGIKEIATALRKAKAAGMREAAEVCDLEAPTWHEVTGNPCQRLSRAIRAAADNIEKGEPNG